MLKPKRNEYTYLSDEGSSKIYDEHRYSTWVQEVGGVESKRRKKMEEEAIG